MNTQTPTNQELPVPKVCFIASLANGETIIEGKREWAWKKGVNSPWNRLIRYALDKKTSITSLSLLTPHGVTFTIPPMGGKPRFTGYTNTEKPIDYHVGRHLIRDMDVGLKGKVANIEHTEIQEFYTYAEAFYKDFSVQLWVDEINPVHSWVVIKQYGR